MTLNPDQDTHDPKKSPTDPLQLAKTVVNNINAENSKAPEARGTDGVPASTSQCSGPPQLGELSGVERITERFVVSSESNV